MSAATSFVLDARNVRIELGDVVLGINRRSTLKNRKIALVGEVQQFAGDSVQVYGELVAGCDLINLTKLVGDDAQAKQLMQQIETRARVS